MNEGRARSKPPDQATRRFASLDGARGIAALVVVVHHSLLAVWPSVANTYFGANPRRWSVAWWLSETPIHALWAGPEAVIVFFVLSGFVLALPAVKYGVRWFGPSYYPKRLLRLYVPVWGAILLAAGVRWVQSRPKLPESSLWLQAHAVRMTLHGGLVQASLRDQGTWAFNPVLWSLHWEILYSLVLPVGLLAAFITGRRLFAGLLVAGGACAFSGWGAATGSVRLTYLPMFLIGSVLAFHWVRLAQHVRVMSTQAVAGVGLGAVCLLMSTYWIRLDWFNASSQSTVVGVSKSVEVLSAAILILLTIARTSWSSLLERKVPRWLGSRSYSLYLVHEPIVVTLAFAVGVRTPIIVFLAIALPASLVSAELFWRLVESPSIRASHRAEELTSVLLRRLLFSSTRSPERQSIVEELL